MDERIIMDAQEALYLDMYVAFLLSSIRLDDENVYSSTSSDIPFDIELKNGLKLLDLPKNTYVEVKKNILFNTFEKINWQIEKAKNTDAVIKQILIVYKNSSFHNNQITYYTRELSRRTGVVVEAMALEDLRQKILEINGKFSTESINISDPVERIPWEKKREELLESARCAIKNNRITLFLGAGVGTSAGMPKWDELLKALVNQKRKNAITKRNIAAIKKVNFNSSLIIGRYIKSADSTLDIPGSVQKILYKKVKPSLLVDSLCRFIDSGCIESVITYNYDMLIEDTLPMIKTKSGTKVAPVYGNNRIGKDLIPVYHVHGVIPNPKNKSSLKPDIVLTEDEYHKLYLNSYDWSNIEQLHALDRNTCFFVGLSMSDPNLRRLLDFSHTKQEEDKPCHYVFLRRVRFEKHSDVEQDNENWDNLEMMFSSLGLNVIWYNDHDDLPDLIDSLY